VRWVAQDDDSLGYDIEDLNSSPSRRIEVKSSSGDDIRFFLSANEWDEAQTDPENYEIQFWGGIRLEAPPLAEYRRLTSAGYPLVYTNPVRLAENGELDLAPANYVLRPSAARDSAEDGAPAPPAGG
jgi:hypothetical protein